MSLRARFTPALAGAGPTEEAESRAAAMLARQRGRPGIAPAPKAAKAAAAVMRPLLAQAGVGFSELKRRWAEIVGEPFASKAAPTALAGGVLTVRAPSSAAPFLAHQTDLLIERLRLAGVKASAVRIEQRASPAPGPERVRRIGRALSHDEETALAEGLAQIGDPGLKSALLRLGRAVKQG